MIRRDGNRVDLVFEIREGDLTEIERIGFVGNRAFPTSGCATSWDQAGGRRNFIRRDTFAPDRLPVDEKLLTDLSLARLCRFPGPAVAPEVARERDAFYITFLRSRKGPAIPSAT